MPRAGQHLAMGAAVLLLTQSGGRGTEVPVLFCVPGTKEGRGMVRPERPIWDTGRQLPVDEWAQQVDWLAA